MKNCYNKNMIKKKIFMTLLLIVYLLPIGKIYAQATNAGFVPGNIWYSEDPFQEGDKIKIYTLIFNPDTRKFSGKVDFYDKDVLLGSKDFNIAGTSTKDISINWTVTAGDHSIFGQIVNAKFLTSSGTYTSVTLSDNKTDTSSRTVTNKVIAQNINNAVNSVDTTFNNALDSINNIGDTAKNAIPDSVSGSLVTTTGNVESFRANTNTMIANAKTEAQNNIKTLNNTKAGGADTASANYIEKPFEYLKLVAYTILGAIFKNKVLFYGISVIIVLLILRYLFSFFFF
jgi:hypothetical protein